jgi:hypothetical protein
LTDWSTRRRFASERLPACDEPDLVAAGRRPADETASAGSNNDVGGFLMGKWTFIALLLIGATLLGGTALREPIASAAQTVSATIVGPLDGAGMSGSTSRAPRG